jgi:hypothetical protein
MQDIRGDIKKYSKSDIAMQYLNLALSEYVKGQNMFAVIHLAGAAEELLGQIVYINTRENALSRDQQSMRSWYAIREKNTPSNKELNDRIFLKAKNGIKHINKKDPADLEIEIDPLREAKEVIRRAIENFNQIPELKHSDELIAYYEHEKT